MISNVISKCVLFLFSLTEHIIVKPIIYEGEAIPARSELQECGLGETTNRNKYHRYRNLYNTAHCLV
jgi:hypothetical protein